MMGLKAYTEWKQLFNENVSSAWQDEASPDLKKLSMLLSCIKNEIKKIEDNVEKDVSNLRKKVIEAPKKQDILLKVQCGGTNTNKENIELKKTEISFSQSQNITVDSPEMFKPVEQPLFDTTDSIIISDEEYTVTSMSNESPEIKKKKRNHSSQKHSERRQRIRDRNSTTIGLLTDLNTQQNDGNNSEQNSQQNAEKREQTSVLNDKSSMEFFRGLIGYPQVVNPLKTSENCNMKSKEPNLTPVKSDVDIDSSIVQCTPVPVSIPKRRDKASYLSKKKCKRENKSVAETDQTTLTQIFSNKNTKNCKDNRSRLQDTNYDSDETYFNPARGSTTNNIGSVMGITRMVSYLNADSPSKEEVKKPSQGIINLDPNTQEIADFVDDLRYEDFEEDGSLNSAIMEEDEKDQADVAEGLNEFLAKAQNVPHQLEPEPVVRGKARKLLPAWSCKDCEKFYVNQGLNASEILALNQRCSKHRGYYRPREDTLPGFWDMNINTPKTQNSE